MKKKYSLISTLIAGIATSMLIYSRYLFLAETLYTLLFMLLIYIILRNWKKQNRDILISFIFALYIFFSHSVEFGLVLFIFFLYLFHKYKIIKFVSIFVIFNILALLLSSFYIINFNCHLNLAAPHHSACATEVSRVRTSPIRFFI